MEHAYDRDHRLVAVVVSDTHGPLLQANRSEWTRISSIFLHGSGGGCGDGSPGGSGVVHAAVMDVVRDLLFRSDRMANDPLPAAWCRWPALADLETFGELVRRLRRLDRRSDAAIRALGAAAAEGDGEACLIVVAALLPLLMARCERQPSLVVEAVSELAARVPDAAEDVGQSSVANRLLRRVVWRVRHERGEHGWLQPVADPAVLAEVPTNGAEETAVLDRLALVEFRRRLTALPSGPRVWAVLSAVADPSATLTSTDRSRLMRSRRLIRDLADSTLVA
ncbi:MAG: hypothetical protein QM733_04455 [Ilumatobacteraceae bacterium]